MNARERAALDKWIMRGPPEEPEYCEDGRCGACPGCKFAEGDEEYHRHVNRQLEMMTDEEWRKVMEGK